MNVDKIIKCVGMNICIMYPVFELSRLIIGYWDTYGLLAPFWLELALIWGGYIGFNYLMLRE